MLAQNSLQLFNRASVFPVVRIVHGVERRGLILSFFAVKHGVAVIFSDWTEVNR